MAGLAKGRAEVFVTKTDNFVTYKFWSRYGILEAHDICLLFSMLLMLGARGGSPVLHPQWGGALDGARRDRSLAAGRD